MSRMRYDLIVIGAGSGGLNIASAMHKFGFRVLLVEKDDAHIGGECLNVGCVPSKALIHAARTVAAARASKQFGVAADGPADMAKVRAYITNAQNTIRAHENAAHFRTMGMDVVLGVARFVSPDSVVVGTETYTGKKIIIATGLRPRTLDIPGIEHTTIHTNETIFTLDTLPKELLVVGGGPIGAEIGQAFALLGTTVTIVQSEQQFLPKEDPAIANVLYDAFIRDGITVRFGVKPVRITDPRHMIVVDAEGRESTIAFDAVLAAIGRVPDHRSLELHNANIKVNDRGHIVVDEYLRTTNPRVYVAGDAAGGYQFTHMAEVHAALLLRNFFSPIKRKLNTDFMAWVTYTSPEIATFGLSEAELKRRGRAVRIVTKTFSDDDRAITDGYQSGVIRLLIEGKYIVGGSIVAPHAGEMISELVLAMTERIPYERVFQKITPYPIAGRIVRSALGGLMSERLTPAIKRLFRLLYR